MAENKTGPKSTLLPAIRIRTIMKSSPEISAISQESLYLITKATELFVGCLAQESLECMNESRASRGISYKDLANVVNDKDEFQFLADVVPKKVLAADYLKMMKQLEREAAGNC